MIFDLRRLVAQPVGADGEGRADGGGVAGQADLEAVDVLQQPVVVERERAHQVGLAGEDDHADAVVGPGLDELADRLAHDLDAAEFLAVLVVIERLHRGRKIDGQHHVDAAFLHLRARVDLLRPRQRDDESRRARDSAARRASRPAGPCDRARASRKG